MRLKKVNPQSPSILYCTCKKHKRALHKLNALFSFAGRQLSLFHLCNCCSVLGWKEELCQCLGCLTQAGLWSPVPSQSISLLSKYWVTGWIISLDIQYRRYFLQGIKNSQELLFTVKFHCNTPPWQWGCELIRASWENFINVIKLISFLISCL